MQRERRVANRGIPPSRISSSPFNEEDAHLRGKMVWAIHVKAGLVYKFVKDKSNIAKGKKKGSKIRLRQPY